MDSPGGPQSLAESRVRPSQLGADSPGGRHSPGEGGRGEPFPVPPPCSARHRLGTGRRGQSPGTSPDSPGCLPAPPGLPWAARRAAARLGEADRGSADPRSPAAAGRPALGPGDSRRAESYSPQSARRTPTGAGNQAGGALPGAPRVQRPAPLRPLSARAASRGAWPGRGLRAGRLRPGGSRVAGGQRQEAASGRDPPMWPQAGDTLTLGRGV